MPLTRRQLTKQGFHNITALTDDGIDELTDMLRDARLTAETWHQFLDDFVSDPELAQRFKAQPPR